ncbi:hypothetical protein Tco_0482698, partial [Tanacetum coccineum]
QDTSRPTHGNDCFMPRCRLLLESESRALAPSFRFRLFHSHHRLEFSPGNMVSIDES